LPAVVGSVALGLCGIAAWGTTSFRISWISLSVREKRSSPVVELACVRFGADGSCAAAVSGCSVSAVKVTRTTPAIGRSAFDLNTVSPLPLGLRDDPARFGFLQQPVDFHALRAHVHADDLQQPLACVDKLIEYFHPRLVLGISDELPEGEGEEAFNRMKWVSEYARTRP